MRNIRGFCIGLALALPFVVTKTSQAQSMMYIALPNAKVQFMDSSGVPISGGLLYSYRANTTMAQPTYTDPTGSQVNDNPVVLDSNGRATVYLPPALTYRLELRTSAGSLVWTQDNVTNASFVTTRSLAAQVWSDNVNNNSVCDQFAGTTADAKVAACIRDLPVTGGVADATGIRGAQIWSGDPCLGVTKPVVLKLGASTIIPTANVTCGINVTISADRETLFDVPNGVTLTLGQFDAGLSKHFTLTGTGKVTFGPAGLTRTLHPEWWGFADGATGDGIALRKTCGAAPEYSVIQLPAGTYYLGSTGSHLDGTGARCAYSKPSNIVFRGEGIGATHLTYTSGTEQLCVSAALVGDPGCKTYVKDLTWEDFTIEDLTTNGNFRDEAMRVYPVGKGVYIRRVEFINARGNAAITMGGDGNSSTDVYVENCIIRGTGTPDLLSDGINIGSTNNVHILGNRFLGGFYRYAFEGGGHMSGTWITDNYIDGINVGGRGIGNFTGQNQFIERNTILNTSVGILLTGEGATAPANIVIANNTITEGMKSMTGIWAQSNLDRVMMIDNIITCRQPFIVEGGTIYSLSIEGNNVHTTANGGLLPMIATCCSTTGEPIDSNALFTIRDNEYTSDGASMMLLRLAYWSNAKTRSLNVSHNRIGVELSASNTGQVDGHTGDNSRFTVNAGTTSTARTVKMQGALLGDVVSVLSDVALPEGVRIYGEVTDSDTITYWIANQSAANYTTNGPRRFFVDRK